MNFQWAREQQQGSKSVFINTRLRLSNNVLKRKSLLASSNQRKETGKAVQVYEASTQD